MAANLGPSRITTEVRCRPEEPSQVLGPSQRVKGPAGTAGVFSRTAPSPGKVRRGIHLGHVPVSPPYDTGAVRSRGNPARSRGDPAGSRGRRKDPGGYPPGIARRSRLPGRPTREWDWYVSSDVATSQKTKSPRPTLSKQKENQSMSDLRIAPNLIISRAGFDTAGALLGSLGDEFRNSLFLFSEDSTEHGLFADNVVMVPSEVSLTVNEDGPKVKVMAVRQGDDVAAAVELLVPVAALLGAARVAPAWLAPGPEVSYLDPEDPAVSTRVTGPPAGPRPVLRPIPGPRGPRGTPAGSRENPAKSRGIPREPGGLPPPGSYRDPSFRSPDTRERDRHVSSDVATSQETKSPRPTLSKQEILRIDDVRHSRRSQPHHIPRRLRHRGRAHRLARRRVSQLALPFL